MKLSELKLIKQWHSYVGPTDERLEKESCKIYRTGFLLLTSGMLLYFIYGLTADQVAWIHNISNDPHSNFQTTISPLLIWLFIVCVICAFIQTRKGFIDTNRFAETDEFPLGYFALISGLVSTLAVFVIWAMRCIAELQIASADEVFWIANLAVGMVFGIILFVLLLLIFFLYYISAKHSRARIESKLNKEQ